MLFDPASASPTGFDALLGLEYQEVGPDRVVATFRIRPELWQPFGLVHGGVYCAVVESTASVGAAVWLGERGRVVGVHNATDFFRGISEGDLTVVATPIHRGRSQQVWQVRVGDADDRLIARGEVRLQNLEAGRGPGAG